jgi:hypothetical protein
MKKSVIVLMFSIGLFTLLSLSSCGKKCYTCVGGDRDGRELCSDDGYGKISMKQHKQDCKAGGGSIN